MRFDFVSRQVALKHQQARLVQRGNTAAIAMKFGRQTTEGGQSSANIEVCLAFIGSHSANKTLAQVLNESNPMS